MDAREGTRHNPARPAQRDAFPSARLPLSRQFGTRGDDGRRTMGPGPGNIGRALAPAPASSRSQRGHAPSGPRQRRGLGSRERRRRNPGAVVGAARVAAEARRRAVSWHWCATGQPYGGRGVEGEMRSTMAPAALITRGGVGVASPSADSRGESVKQPVGWVSAKIAGGCNFTK